MKDMLVHSIGKNAFVEMTLVPVPTESLSVIWSVEETPHNSVVVVTETLFMRPSLPVCNMLII